MLDNEEYLEDLEVSLNRVHYEDFDNPNSYDPITEVSIDYEAWTELEIVPLFGDEHRKRIELLENPKDN